MSGIQHINKMANASTNPNNHPSDLDFLNEAEYQNMFAVKIQKCVRDRDVRRASKKMRKAVTNQTYRLKIIKYLSKCLQDDICDMLIVGYEDSEIHASFSQFE